ncbi:MAG: hypothetical protein R3C58_10035 [Parvularculaceae bacterium]
MTQTYHEKNRAWLFWWYWLLTTPLVFLAILLWLTIPLLGDGLGCPKPSALRFLAEKLFLASYFLGIPVLFLAHFASGFFAFKGRRALAYRFSFAAWGFFIVCISIVIALCN